MRFSIYCGQTTSAVAQRFGVRSFNGAGTNIGTKAYHPVTLNPVSTVNNLNLWEGSVVNGWRHMVAYIVGANADINAAPKSLNVSYIAKLTADTRKLEMFTEVVGSGNSRDVHFYSPSVIKIGSGLIVADEIRAGSKISAPIIDGGTINSGTINGGTINGATGNFSGEVRASKMIGLPSSVAVDGYVSSNRYRGVSFVSRQGSLIFNYSDSDDQASKFDAETLGTIKIPPEEFERKLIVTFSVPEIRIPNSAFTTNLDESVISGSTKPVQNKTYARIVKSSGNPSDPDTDKYPYSKTANDSTLNYRYTIESHRVYSATQDIVMTLVIPAVTDDQTAPDIEYDLQFSILPRRNQTLPAFTAKLFYHKVEAFLVKSEGYNFDVEIGGTM